ncbi:hypothetical protein [Streptomyces sp. NPDC057253]|uniref:hypothetical protein n=1 Tax=Streptomyces sp. NPDC057253 TaxID=3346069 RepID=UPI00363C23EE
MAQVWLRDGLDPDAPEAVVVAVVVDPAGPPEERAVAELFSCAYEGEDSFLLVRTDGWAERRLREDVLTVEIVVNAAVLHRLGAHAAGSPAPAAGSSAPPAGAPDTVRLLRASTRVDPSRYDQALAVTVVLTAPAGAPDERIVAELRSRESWPLILAPPPGGQ